ncbi:MAG: polysaccharide deacetylase family protein [Mariniblastus sp.]|nr:polysaccharide deacetylase family protein [Mariniblastus sp.]
MSHWKTKLIDAYRLASWPVRQWRFREMCEHGTVPAISLFYHRVADTDPNPWTIRCDEFQQQIDWFQENFDIVDLQELQRRIVGGFNDRPTLSITFDDGYAENCEFAMPMLVERRIPVTYFVTTFHTTEQQPFAHDVERETPLAANTIESLRALDLAGVEIAGHSRNHLDLGKISCEKTLVDEVLTASQEMEDLIGRKLRYFAFPFGQHDNLNPRVFSLLREAGFLGVCSAYGGWNKIGGDPFHIQRIHGDPDFSRMKNWLTFDPRISRVSTYDYSMADGSSNSPVETAGDFRGVSSDLKVPAAKVDIDNKTENNPATC